MVKRTSIEAVEQQEVARKVLLSPWYRNHRRRCIAVFNEMLVSIVHLHLPILVNFQSLRWNSSLLSLNKDKTGIDLDEIKTEITVSLMVKNLGRKIDPQIKVKIEVRAIGR